MRKRLTLLFMSLCLIFGLVACGKPATQKESRPENWDVEAEVLRFCNGYLRAKTAEELKPYVLSETSDARVKEVMDQLNASMSGLAGTLDYRDYPYDSVEVTYLDTYEGFEILWVKTASSAFRQAEEEYTSQMLSSCEFSAVTHISSNLLMVLAIENGHYVTSLDEAFINEVLKLYDYCQSCHGQGGISYPGWECSACNGEGTQTAYLCQDCNTVNYPGQMPFPGGNADGIQTNLSSLTGVSLGGLRAQCTQCGGSNFTETQTDCSNCLGSGGEEDKFESCATCSGNGWIKK